MESRTSSASCFKTTALVLCIVGILVLRRSEAAKPITLRAEDQDVSVIENQSTNEKVNAETAGLSTQSTLSKKYGISVLQTPAAENEEPSFPPSQHDIVGPSQPIGFPLHHEQDDAVPYFNVESRWFPADSYAAKLKKMGLLAESVRGIVSGTQPKIFRRLNALLPHVLRFGDQEDETAEENKLHVFSEDTERKRTKRSWADFWYDDDYFEESCDYPPCPAWSEWHGTEMCNATCGGGKRLLVRYCDNSHADEPQGGCLGESTKHEECNAHPCPSWSDWTAAGRCSTTCGKGTRKFTRKCLLDGKTTRDCHGPNVEFRVCSTNDSCPAHWTNWSRFGTCSKTCGFGGFQTRRRLCVVNGKAMRGRMTPCQGFNAQQRRCSAQPSCHERFSQWSVWSHCDAMTCDAIGFQRRSRKCLAMNGKPLSKYMMKCKPGQLEEQRKCRAVSCAKACSVVVPEFSAKISSPQNYSTPKPTWSQWTGWSACTVSCGLGGRQTRSRMCFGVRIDQENGTVVVKEDKTCSGKPIETRNCHYDAGCPHWDLWQKWGGCSRSCGFGGKRKRARSCMIEIYDRFNAGEKMESSHILQKIENLPPIEEGSEEQKRSAGERQWENLPRVTLFSGGDDLYRKERRLLRTVSLNLHWCEGRHNASTAVSSCNEHPCPPKWGRWQAWSVCSATCGKGQAQRSRRCIGTGQCYGNKFEFKECYQPPCWTEWSSYTPCTKSCGSGEKMRYRTCRGTSMGVQAYRKCEGPQQQSVACNEEQCPKWGEWTEWGNCSLLCGLSGTMIRSRECLQGECGSKSREIASCNFRPCPYLSQWSTFSCCSTSCGDGTKKRNRRCRHGKLGDEGCEGPLNDTQPCNPGPCNATAPPPLDLSRCGVKPKNRTKFILKIFNGAVSADHEWPWQASWQHYTCEAGQRKCEWEHLCGATLLGPQWAITAGHCTEEWYYRVVHDDPGDEWSVVIGMTKLQQTGDRFFLRRVVLYPDYEYPSVPNHDVALLKLRNPVPISDFAMPACLPENNAPAPGEECFVTGWGHQKNSLGVSQLLRDAPIPIMDFGECQKLGSLYKNFLDPKMHMCAGNVSNPKAPDSCKGDSGGPMVCLRPDGKWYLAGITSFGFTDCGTPGQAGIYVPLKHYEDWVTREIEKYSRNGC